MKTLFLFPLLRLLALVTLLSSALAVEEAAPAVTEAALQPAVETAGVCPPGGVRSA